VTLPQPPLLGLLMRRQSCSTVRAHNPSRV
jgi:hypothetical protein